MLAMTAIEWWLILGMLTATFSTRYVLFAMASKVRFSPLLHSALGFVPPVVLTAIIQPAVVMPKGEVWLHWQNPWLLAALVAVGVALWRRDLLTTIVLGMLAFVVFRWLLV